MKNIQLTQNQIESLRGYQESPYWHAYTCGFGHGAMSVNEDGLYCDKCDYKQTYIHGFALDWDWKINSKPRRDK